jgi:hypothetical protein
MTQRSTRHAGLGGSDPTGGEEWELMARTFNAMRVDCEFTAKADSSNRNSGGK